MLGAQGAGLSSLAPGRVDLIMGTFSKALGGFGAYVAGSRVMCDYLVNACSGFIYTTALPPAVLGAMDAALDLLPRLDAERSRLADSAQTLRAALAGWAWTRADPRPRSCPPSSATKPARWPWPPGWSGLLAVAIRPPTVPAGTSRLRIALSAAHGERTISPA